MKKILIILVWCLVGFSTVFGQSRGKYIEAAQNSFATKDYYSALSYYLEAVEFDSSDTDVQYNLAESARLFNAYHLAEQAYQKVLDQDTSDTYPMAPYYLGEMKQRLGKYEEAKDLFNTYISEQGEEGEFFTEKARKCVAACDWSVDRLSKTDDHITISSLGAEVNTPYSEFGAIKNEDDLYFSSLRFPTDQVPGKIKALFSKILISKEDGPATVIEGDINSDLNNVAHTSFSPDGKMMFYTLCKYVTDADIRCDLYSRTIEGKDNFGPETKLPAHLNDTTYTSTQPHVYFDKASGEKRLYFTSDMPGGKGKLDIWYSVIADDGTYGQPVNLEINTPEDELTPFYHGPSQTLYFSSDGYLGLGGYDVYSSRFHEGTFGTPVHLNDPTNSSFHDVYYTLSEEGDVAHMSSNREGSMYLDDRQRACCYDIYKLDIEQLIIDLNALTFDRLTRASLEGATVQLIDTYTGEIIAQVTNDEGNDHYFKLERNRNYKIIASKEHFYPDSTLLSTEAIGSSDTIVKRLYLDSDKYNLEVLTFDKTTLESLNGATVRLIDMTNEEAADEIQVNELSNDFYFLVESDRKYQIKAIKEGYAWTIDSLDTTGEKLSRTYSRKLYLERLSINKFLPVFVYFDNDQPNPGSNSMDTDKMYSDTYYPYMDRRAVFKRRNSGEADQLDEFFETKVFKGYIELQTFFDELYNLMEKGNSYEITVRGFASPKAPTKYNLVLGQRRVNSILNEMAIYRGGILKKHIDSGQLKITDISFGEELVPEGISDSPFDRKNSVYSVKASEERRIEILKVSGF